MAVEAQPSFNRPPVSVPLWRYTDHPRFIDLLTSQELWMSNLEALAVDDPYEGSPWPITFPHRMWSKIEDVPEPPKTQILNFGGSMVRQRSGFNAGRCLRSRLALRAGRASPVLC